MANRIEDIGALFLQRRKELGLTQEQLGERIGVSKSEISKIENGRGITFATINKLSEALDVTTEIALRPKSNITADAIHFIVMGMGLFARRFKLTKREACNYLSRFKGLEFTINHYEAEHQLSLQECVDDMAAICQRNGGTAQAQNQQSIKKKGKDFEFLVEYITAKVVEWIIRDRGFDIEQALVFFHNSETFEKLCQRKTDMFLESPAYVYDIFQDEMKRGTIRGLGE